MATTTTIDVTNSSFFIEGKSYAWTVVELTGLTRIDTVVTNITTSTVDITYDELLLPLGVTELTECHLKCPVLILESCCDKTFYDFEDSSGLEDLAGAGIPVTVPLGDNIIRIGGNPSFPFEIWEYTGSGDPQQLVNWTRTEILPQNGEGGIGDDWGAQVVVSDGTLTGTGVAGDPLSAVQSFSDGITITGTGAALNPFVAAPPTNITSDYASSGSPGAPPANSVDPAIHFALDGVYWWDSDSTVWRNDHEAFANLPLNSLTLTTIA
jgi:hypothetical protein